ncbi:MAG: ATP synthase F0 subunit B [Clostridiales bacterium]|nr:ATP synthase F0 subunit B [Clostridiales bacterium]
MILFISDTNLFETLGLNGWSILFYAINLVVLVGGLTLLLYKPIKKMLKEKRESLDNTYKENERLKAESEQIKSEYEKKTAELKAESARISAEVADAAKERADAIITEAKEQAKSIVESAKTDALYQKEQLKNEYRDSVNKLSVEIAQKLLERELSSEDNDALIEQVLSDWEE